MIRIVRNILLAISSLLVIGVATAEGASNPATIPVVSSVSGLQALGAAAPLYPNIYVLGYSSALSPGGGMFSWQAPASSNNNCTVDGGIIFAATGVSTSTGCYVRQYSGAIRTSMYGVTSGSDCTSQLNAMFTTGKALSINVHLMHDSGVCTLTTSSSRPLDTSTLPGGQLLFLSGPFIQPGLTYIVRQTSGGGTVWYAGTTYTDGQSFTGVPGYKFFNATNARVYSTFSQTALKWDMTGITLTLEGDAYDQSFFLMSGTGAALAIYNSAGSSGPQDLSLKNIAFRGAGDGSSQTLVYGANWKFTGSHQNVYFGQSEVGLYCQDCWNQVFTGPTRFQAAGAYAIFDNNNENHFQYLFLQADTHQAAYTVFRFRDSASSNFVSLGASVGDQVWILDQLGTAVLKGVVTSVGYNDGSTLHTDMLIIYMNCAGCGLSTSSSDISQFGGNSRILFKSGTLSGNQYTMDMNPSTSAGSSVYTEPYLVSRLDSGAVYVGGTESFAVDNGQASNALGEAFIVSYSSNSTSLTSFGHVQFDQEGPANGFVDRPIEYISYTQTGTSPMSGTYGPTINVATSIPFSTAAGYSSAFGQISAVRGTYLAGATITGQVFLNHSAAYGYVCPSTCWNNNLTQLSSQLVTSGTAGFGILDLQPGAGYSPRILTSLSGTEPIIYQSTSFGTGGTGPTVFTGSRVFRTSVASTPYAYGIAGTPPRVFVDADTDIVCGTVSGTSGAYLQAQYDVLADDGVTVKFSRFQQWWATQMVNSVHNLGTIRIPTNSFGQAQVTVTAVGASWATCVLTLKQAQGGF